MSNPSAVNRAKYARAQEYVRSGVWVVDAEAGIVHSRRTRKALRGTVSDNGYLVYGATFPGGSRETARTIPVLAARVVWESVHGTIPDDLEINHKDGNKLNNAISNLELVTRLENISHSIQTGLRGPQPYGEMVKTSRLTEAQVVEIRALLAAGELQQVIADRYNVTQSLVSMINRGKIWRHMGDPTAHLPSGPLRGEQSKSARLTERDVIEIRRMLAEGVFQKEIASRFAVSQSTISLIRMGKVWAHVA